MAIRVQTQDALVFGFMDAGVVATHARFQKADAVPVVKQLAAPVNVAADERLRIPVGMLDVVYLAGELTNAHVMVIVQPYWDGETFQVDLMTDANTVIADAGYSQQVYSNWNITAEPD